MAESESGEEKSIDPTDRKLRKSREEGQVAHAQDFVAGLTLIAVLAYLVIAGPGMLERLEILMRDGAFPPGADFPTRAKFAIDLAFWTTAQIIGPILGVAIAGVIITSLFDLQGFVFSLSPMTPNFTKFNPVEGIKNMFALKSLIDLIRGLIKVIILLFATYIVVTQHLNDAMWAPTCGLACLGEVGVVMTLKIVAVGIILLLVAAAIDLPVSRWLFRRDQMMTLTEFKKEQKEDNGDPDVNAQRRRLRQEASQSAGLVGINKAAIVVLNNEVLIALTYKPEILGVPIVAAKGTGAMASGLLATARERELPIIEDPELAELLRAGKLGEPIPRETYGPVARILNSLGLIKRN
jgi:type III secretion protein U